MNIVCYAGCCAGALMCDLLNDEQGVIHQLGFIKTKKSEELKPGPFVLGDRTSSFHNLALNDQTTWLGTVNHMKGWHTKDIWFGTHLNPYTIPNITDFEKVVNITTVTKKSHWFKFLRAYHLPTVKFFNPESDISVEHLQAIMKTMINDRFLPHDYCTNVEFEDIVSGSFVSDNNLNTEHFEKWKQTNPWLYGTDYIKERNAFDEVWERNET